MYPIVSLFIDATDSIAFLPDAPGIQIKGDDALQACNLYICVSGEEVAGLEVIDRLMSQLHLARHRLTGVISRREHPELYAEYDNAPEAGEDPAYPPPSLVREAADSDPGEKYEPRHHAGTTSIANPNYILAPHHEGALPNICALCRDRLVREAEAVVSPGQSPRR